MDRSLSRPGHRKTIGTFKFFSAQKGFGFIQRDDGSKDVFVHISTVEHAGLSALTRGRKVRFEVQSDRGKPAAGNLELVWDEAPPGDCGPVCRAGSVTVSGRHP